MIELFALQNEKIERFEHKDKEKTLAWMGTAGKGTVWVRCVSPSAEEISELSEITKVPAEELKESVDGDERSRVNVTKYLEIVYKAPITADGEVMTASVHIYSMGTIISTIERTPSKVLNDLSTALIENKRKFLFKKPGGYFIFYVLDKINDEFLHFIDQISVKLDLFNNKGRILSKKNINQVYDASIALSYFNQALIANIEVLNELRKSYYKLFEAEDRKNFSELYHDARQILDTERIQRDLLSNLFNMHATITGNELNKFMKIVAFFALVTTVPTIISNIFSMNIKYIPLTQEKYSFYIVVALVLVSSVISYIGYRIIIEKWN